MPNRVSSESHECSHSDGRVAFEVDVVNVSRLERSSTLVFENGYFRSVLKKLWHTGNNLTIVAMLREQLVSTCTDLLDEYKKTVCNG